MFFRVWDVIFCLRCFYIFKMFFFGDVFFCLGCFILMWDVCRKVEGKGCLVGIIDVFYGVIVF